MNFDLVSLGSRFASRKLTLDHDGFCIVDWA